LRVFDILLDVAQQHYDKYAREKRIAGKRQRRRVVRREDALLHGRQRRLRGVVVGFIIGAII